MTSTLVAIVAAVVGGLVLLKFFAPKSAQAVLHPTEFRRFPLVEKTPVNHNTAIYRFALPRADATFGLPIGQHITVSANINGKDVVRSYTPISTNAQRGFVDLLIKTYPNGNISKHFSELQVGDHILIRGPKGAFNYEPNTIKHLSMIAGGSGVTPMYQIIQAIAANPEDKTTVSLIFANVNEVDIFLRKELDAIAAQRPGQISVHYVLNNPPDNWKGSVGFVTAEVLTAQLPPPSRDSKLLLCGPLPMVAAVKKAAVEIGWDKARAPSKMEDQVFVF